MVVLRRPGRTPDPQRPQASATTGFPRRRRRGWSRPPSREGRASWLPRGAGPGSQCVRCAARRARFRGRPEALETPPQARLTWRRLCGGAPRQLRCAPSGEGQASARVSGVRAPSPGPTARSPPVALFPRGPGHALARVHGSGVPERPGARPCRVPAPPKWQIWNQLGWGKQIKAKWKPGARVSSGRSARWPWPCARAAAAAAQAARGRAAQVGRGRTHVAGRAPSSGPRGGLPAASVRCGEGRS